MASTPIPEALSQLQTKFRSVLSSRQRSELMLIALRSIDNIKADVRNTFDPQGCLFAGPQDDRRDPNPKARPDDLLIDYGQPIESGAYQLELITQDLNSTEIRGVKAAAQTAVQSWRISVLTQFSQALGVSSREILHLNSTYSSPAVTWSLGTSFPRGVKPTPTGLPASLTKEVRKDVVGLVLNIFMLVLVKYNAYARLLMLAITANLDLPSSVLTECENEIAQVLLCNPDDLKSATDKVTKSQQDSSARDRRWKIGAATIAGAAIIGLTGGLAAPLLIGSVASLLGGVGLGGVAVGLGALGAGNPLVIAGIFGAIGGRMSKKAVDEITKEVNDFRFIPLRTQADNNDNNEKNEKKTKAQEEKLRVVIGISGLIENPKSLITPWSIFSTGSVEPFALRYEYATLYRLGTTLLSILRNSAYSLAQASFMQLAIPAIMAAGLLPFSLIKLGGFLDNPFRISMTRSDKAGKVLARTLISKAYGERPVSLIGFSLGARVVYSCLLELAAQNAFGLIENVVLIGAPTPSDANAWRKIRAVTSGRVVNAYSTDDLLLAFLYRASHAQLNIAGLAPIDYVPGVENFDVTHLVNGHRQYLFATGAILEAIGLEDLDQDAVKKQKIILQDIDRYEREIHEKARREGKLKDLEDEHGNLILGEKKKQATVKSSRKAQLPVSSNSSSGPTPEQTFSFYSEIESASQPPRMEQRADGHKYLVYDGEELEIDQPATPPPQYSARTASSPPPSFSTSTAYPTQDRTGTGSNVGSQKIQKPLSSSHQLISLQDDVPPPTSMKTTLPPFGDMNIKLGSLQVDSEDDDYHDEPQLKEEGNRVHQSSNDRIILLNNDSDSDSDSDDMHLVPKEFDEERVWKIEMVDNDY